MKKIINRFKKNPMLLVFLVILVFFAPFALFSPGESTRCSIVTAVGVDKLGEEYEVSLLTFIPTANQTYLETNSVVTGKGKSVAEAISNAGLTLGKKVCLSHAKTTVISTKLMQDDIAKDIDYLGRVASLSENTILICTDNPAKEFLLAAQTLEKDIGLKLEELISYNVDNVYVTDTSVEAFFKGYYSQTGSSIIGYLKLASGEGEEKSQADSSQGGNQSGGGQSGGNQNSGGQGEESGGESGIDAQDEVSGYGSSQASSGGSSGSSSQSGNSDKKVLNSGEVVLIKNGIMVDKLSTEQLHGINIINGNAIDRTITIENVTDESYQDAMLTYTVKNKRVKITTKFENGHPIFRIDVILGLELVEGKEGETNIRTNTELSDISEEVAGKVEQFLKSRFQDTLKVLRKNKTDVIGVTQMFERENKKEFRKFLRSLDDPDDFLNFMNFELVIKVQPD